MFIYHPTDMPAWREAAPVRGRSCVTTRKAPPERKVTRVCGDRAFRPAARRSAHKGEGASEIERHRSCFVYRSRDKSEVRRFHKRVAGSQSARTLVGAQRDRGLVGCSWIVAWICSLCPLRWSFVSCACMRYVNRDTTSRPRSMRTLGLLDLSA